MMLSVRKRKIMNPIQFEKYGTEHESHVSDDSQVITYWSQPKQDSLQTAVCSSSG